MKSIFLLILISVICGCVAATNQSTSSTENTMNVNPKSMKSSNNAMSETDMSMNSVKIGKVEVSPEGVINVEILNPSKKPIKL
jgi:PBP1b-binding outer membrane lipoprotein LpoB